MHTQKPLILTFTILIITFSFLNSHNTLAQLIDSSIEKNEDIPNDLSNNNRSMSNSSNNTSDSNNIAVSRCKEIITTISLGIIKNDTNKNNSSNSSDSTNATKAQSEDEMILFTNDTTKKILSFPFHNPDKKYKIIDTFIGTYQYIIITSEPALYVYTHNLTIWMSSKLEKIYKFVYDYINHVLIGINEYDMIIFNFTIIDNDSLNYDTIPLDKLLSLPNSNIPIDICNKVYLDNHLLFILYDQLGLVILNIHDMKNITVYELLTNDDYNDNESNNNDKESNNDNEDKMNSNSINNDNEANEDVSDDHNNSLYDIEENNSNSTFYISNMYLNAKDNILMVYDDVQHKMLVYKYTPIHDISNDTNKTNLQKPTNLQLMISNIDYFLYYTNHISNSTPYIMDIIGLNETLFLLYGNNDQDDSIITQVKKLKMNILNDTKNTFLESLYFTELISYGMEKSIEEYYNGRDFTILDYVDHMYVLSNRWTILQSMLGITISQNYILNIKDISPNLIIYPVIKDNLNDLSLKLVIMNKYHNKIAISDIAINNTNNQYSYTNCIKDIDDDNEAGLNRYLSYIPQENKIYIIEPIHQQNNTNHDNNNDEATESSIMPLILLILCIAGIMLFLYHKRNIMQDRKVIKTLKNIQVQYDKLNNHNSNKD